MLRKRVKHPRVKNLSFYLQETSKRFGPQDTPISFILAAMAQGIPNQVVLDRFYQKVIELQEREETSLEVIMKEVCSVISEGLSRG